MESKPVVIQSASRAPMPPVSSGLVAFASNVTSHSNSNPEGLHPFLFQSRWPILWPIAFVLTVSALIRWMNLDLKASEPFYDRTRGIWPFELAQPWLMIYQQGIYPPIMLAVGGAVVAVLGRWILPRPELRRSRSIRRAGTFLFLFLLVGPGLIVNVGFKHLWGRPRPIQCHEFNGDKPFLPVGTWAKDRLPNSSFPSGHAAVAFYLMAPGFVTGQKRTRLSAIFFLVGSCFGLGMGLTRVVQGGHFVSDVVWAGAMVYFTGVFLAWLILRNDERESPTIAGP
jgi:lipid A 4'-phosphatase